MMPGTPIENALKELKAEEAVAQRRLVAIQKAKAALEALIEPEPQRESPRARRQRAVRIRRVERNGDGPRGIEAVEKVLAEGEPMTIRQITEAIMDRGWITPDAKAPIEATRVALRRLSEKDDRVIRMDDGRWAFFTGALETGAEEPAGS